MGNDENSKRIGKRGKIMEAVVNFFVSLGQIFFFGALCVVIFVLVFLFVWWVFGSIKRRDFDWVINEFEEKQKQKQIEKEKEKEFKKECNKKSVRLSGPFNQINS